MLNIFQHLGNNNDSLPNDNDYSEMICAGCMKSHEFLWRYATKYSGKKPLWFYYIKH